MWEYLVGLLGLLRAYQGIRFFFIKKRVKGPIKINPEAKSIFIKKGKKIAMLLHGFTTSPKEFKELADNLAKNDISVYAPLLPGHGTSPERLAVTKYYQWVEFVDEQIEMLLHEYEEIYIVGNSFGGNLALISAQKSKKIKGIVTLGTPIFFRREKLNRFFLFPLVKSIKLFQDKKYGSLRAKKLMTTKTWSYQSVPLRSVSQLMKLIKLTKKKIRQVTKPILVMEVVRDHLVDKQSGSFIISKVKSRKKEKITVPESYHMFLVDKHANYVNYKITDFIKNGL